MNEINENKTDKKKKSLLFRDSRGGYGVRQTEIGDESCYFRLRDDAEIPS